MKHVKLITLLLAAGLTACSSDDGTETPPAPRRITVEVTENPFIDSETGSRISLSPLRRADATTTSSLNDFSMSYFYKDNLYKYDFTKTSGKWEPTTYSWPAENDELVDFYAYTGDKGHMDEPANGNFQYNSGNPYITFDVDQNASTQHDLLVAHTKTSYKADGGKVCFTFDHACAAVQFRIGQSQALSKEGVAFTKIALVGVYNKGDYYYYHVDDEFKPTWDNLSGAENSIYTLESGSSISIPVSQTKHQGARPLTCGYLFMIPQSLYTAKLLIEYSYNSNNYYYPIPMAQTSDDKWEAGVEYTINVRLGSELLTDGTEKTTSTQ